MNQKAQLSAAIRAEVKRHEAVRSNLSKLLKLLDRVSDAPLQSRLKMQLLSIQGAFQSSSHGVACCLGHDGVSAVARLGNGGPPRPAGMAAAGTESAR
ncbi:AGAP1 protein, partial [Polypterus senegalus]